MSLLSVLLDVLCTFNEIFWLCQWINVLLEKKEFVLKWKNSRVVEYGLYASYVIVVSSLNRIALTSAYTMIVILIMNLIAVLCFWKSDIIQAFAIVGGYFFALFLEGNLFISIVGMIGGDELVHMACEELGTARLLNLLINGTLWFLINWAGTSYIKKKAIHMQSMKYIACVSVIGFIGCGFIGMIMLSSFNIQINTVWYAFLIFLLMVVFGIYFVMKQRETQRETQLRMTILSTKNEMLERNYMQVNEFYTANAKLYHDMNHHFDAVYHMLQQGEQEQAKKYIEGLRNTNNYSGMKVQTGINVLDAVLYEIDLKSQKKGVTFEVETTILPYDLGVESSDICSLFANLLENAVEAASKEILLQIKKGNQTLFVTVKNDYSVEPVRKGKRFITQKKEKNLHGWGTQIVEQIVQKYEGSIEYETEDGYFTAYVMLNEMLE